MIMCWLVMAVVIMEQWWSDSREKPKKFGGKFALHLQLSPRLCIDKFGLTN
jgi:hypothetical protein